MYKYVGNGSFLAGIPPTDLTDEEFAQLAKAFKEREGVTIEKAPEFKSLYEHVDDKKPAKE